MVVASPQILNMEWQKELLCISSNADGDTPLTWLSILSKRKIQHPPPPWVTDYINHKWSGRAASEIIISKETPGALQCRAPSPESILEQLLLYGTSVPPDQQRAVYILPPYTDFSAEMWNW